MKFNVTPCLTVDANQNVSGGLLGEFEHGGSTFRMRVNDSIKDGGNPLDACTLGLKNETMQLSWDCGNNVGRLRMYGGLNVKDKRVNVKATTNFNANSNETYLNCTSDLDADNTVRLIMQAKGGERPSHRNMILGFIHRQNDFEIEPRYNLATESVSCGVTYRVDDDNRLRAIFDQNTNMGSLQWVNNGALGGGGELRITAKATMDKDGMKQMPTVMLEKTWDLDM